MNIYTDNEEHFLKFEITLTQISISIQGCLIHLLMTVGTSFCFR